MTTSMTADGHEIFMEEYVAYDGVTVYRVGVWGYEVRHYTSKTRAKARVAYLEKCVLVMRFH